MVIVGIDAHKRTHTAVAIDEAGRKLGEKTTRMTTTEANLELLRWADGFGPDRRFGVEDCRHLSRRLEVDLLAAGEQIVRVPPKLMAHARDAARTYGKSDPIDALAVARAVLREPNLPLAHLDARTRDLRLLVDHREDLVRDRVGLIDRLRWHLHELDPGARVFVERHLSGCDPCTERVDFRRRVKELIATKCAGEEVPADLRARIQDLLAGIARS